MASSQPPADRPDIHKSCRALETLLTVLNDYCEAAGAVVTLQKKLARALREAAGMKVTAEVPANTMNASATIFEVLADVDAKFAKMADREYDSVSGEVKKWFKKLAKEEKMHDERMASANAKIKQAGQAYEKKSKKKSVDMTDEHARYINLISTLGPEISQEKHTHALTITQRHSTTTYSAAAALARLADAEWLRACEGVRRCAPTVGGLGQWRALCEGGWAGGVPRDLADVEQDGLEGPQGQGQGPEGQGGEERWREEEEEREKQRRAGGGGLLPPDQQQHAQTQSGRTSRESFADPPSPLRPGPPPGYSSSADLSASQELAPPPAQAQHSTASESRDASPVPQTQRPQPHSFSTSGSTSTAPSTFGGREGASHVPSAFGGREGASHPPSAFGGREGASHPPSAFADPTAPGAPKHPWVDPNTGSVRSLSAFPAPPTHFPIPPLRDASPAPARAPGHTQGMGRVTESPLPEDQDDDEDKASPLPVPQESTAPTPSPRGSPEQGFQRPRGSPEQNFQRPPRGVTTPGEAESSANFKGGEVASQGREPPSQSREPASPSRDLPTPSREPPSQSKETASTSRDPPTPSKDPPSPSRMRVDTRDREREVGRGEYFDDVREFGAGKPRTSADGVGREASGSGSIVAAMRSRYANNSGSSSPPPKDIPRLPLSVPDLATRYQPGVGEPSSPVPRAKSPPIVTRRLSLPPPPDSTSSSRSPPSPEHPYRPPVSPARGGSSIPPSSRQRIDERAEQEYEARERELRERERDIEMRARELERERVRLRGVRRDSAGVGEGEEEEEFPIRQRERGALRLQQQRPVSAHVSAGPGQPQSQPERPRTQYSYSATHLVPPASPGGRYPQQRELHTQYEYQDPDPEEEEGNQHAPYCGCETCSVAKYRSPSTTTVSSSTQPISNANTLRPPAPEKPKGGWMRRLSMPVVVGNAFNLDSKRERKDSNAGRERKNSSTARERKDSSTSGMSVGVGKSMGKGVGFSLDAKKNVSATALRVQEDGRMGMGRTSYEGGMGMGNRSMTNLGVAGRR